MYSMNESIMRKIYYEIPGNMLTMKSFAVLSHLRTLESKSFGAIK